MVVSRVGWWPEQLGFFVVDPQLRTDPGVSLRRSRLFCAVIPLRVMLTCTSDRFKRLVILRAPASVRRRWTVFKS